MAYKVKNYGNGELGDVSDVTATINSYARVTAVDSSSVTINTTTQVDGAAVFKAGAKVLLHVSATTGEKTYLGKYLLTEITAIDNGVLTLADDPTAIMPSDQLGKYYMQAIAVAQYRNLTIATGTNISPPAYSVTSYLGGIVAIMCSESLVFNGGNISLTDRGIPTSSTALRPQFNQEGIETYGSGGRTDGGLHAGWENDCSRKFPLNCGDGAVFIVAKSMTFSTASRIGNVATYGVQFYRGATVSVTYNETPPNNVTNVGGSSIFIAAETIKDFSCRMIAKYRSSSATAGQGLCRCYIASETKLRTDEGLYSYDCISNKSRIHEMNIKNFGNGSFGDLNNVTTQLNNYATITAIDGNKITYKDKTTAGLAPIVAGALVMIHFNQRDMSKCEQAGKFILANVLSDNGTILTLDTIPPNIINNNCDGQVVSIPQANNFTLSGVNNSTPVYGNCQGGICAIAVKETFNLTGMLLTERAGGAVHYGHTGLSVIGNAQDSDKLPIGAGHGSVFILAKNIIMNTSTRIGASYSGANFGGARTYYSGDNYKPIICQYWRGYAGWDIMTPTSTTSSGGGCGARGGLDIHRNLTLQAGGYGGNGYRNGSLVSGKSFQGAHVCIVANTIKGFNQSAISTGGSYGYFENNTRQAFYPFCIPSGVLATTGGYESYGGKYGSGGAGYGGGSYNACGGFNGGASAGHPQNAGGGSSGWAFVYCNHAIDQDTTGTTYDD